MKRFGDFWVALLKRHHVYQMDDQPSGIISVVVREKMRKKFSERITVHSEVGFPEGPNKHESQKFHFQDEVPVLKLRSLFCSLLTPFFKIQMKFIAIFRKVTPVGVLHQIVEAASGDLMGLSGFSYI